MIKITIILTFALLTNCYKNRTKLPLNPVSYKLKYLKFPASFLHSNAAWHAPLCWAHIPRPSLIGCMAKRWSNESLIGGNVLLASHWLAVKWFSTFGLTNEMKVRNLSMY